jgi:hypothetical protein
MSRSSDARWNEGRAARGELIGAGWFVFARGRTTGRIKIPTNTPWEYATEADAMRYARQLAAKNPGRTFDVFRIAASVTSPLMVVETTGEPTP